MSTFADCDFGYFGFDCNGTCHCALNLACDPVNGKCPEGCEEGYVGPTCSVAKKPQGNVIEHNLNKMSSFLLLLNCPCTIDCMHVKVFHFIM